MVRKKGLNLFWVGLIFIAVVVFLGAVYFYNTTGFAVDGTSNASTTGISVGEKCSGFGVVACCENCECAGGSGCACTCSIVNHSQIWTGICCENGCHNGVCKNYMCSSNIPLGYSCHNNYERYAQDSNQDGCVDNLITRRCKGACVNGQCENDEYVPSCYSMNPINSGIDPYQCMSEGNDLQWSMVCAYDNYEGNLCLKGCDSATGYCK